MILLTSICNRRCYRLYIRWNFYVGSQLYGYLHFHRWWCRSDLSRCSLKHPLLLKMFPYQNFSQLWLRNDPNFSKEILLVEQTLSEIEAGSGRWMAKINLVYRVFFLYLFLSPFNPQINRHRFKTFFSRSFVISEQAAGKLCSPRFRTGLSFAISSRPIPRYTDFLYRSQFKKHTLISSSVQSA